MKVIWLENQKLSFRSDVPIPVPRAGEALIRVSMAGICSTDLELLRGYYPFTGIPVMSLSVWWSARPPKNPGWASVWLERSISPVVSVSPV
jgi:hypothetical protein